MIIDWPVGLTFKTQMWPMLVNRGASSGRSMTGAERVIFTDAGYWQLGATIRFQKQADVMAWKALLAMTEGRSNVIRFPVFDKQTTPADLAGTRATLQAAIDAAGVTYSDGATHSDLTSLDQGLITANSTFAYTAGVTVMSMDFPTGYAPSIGQLFSDGNHLYQVKAFSRVVGRRYSVEFRPRLRKDAYDGSQFSFDRLFCLTRFDSEETYSTQQAPDYSSEVSLTLVEAVS